MQAAHGKCPEVRPRLRCALCAIKPPANFGVNATFFNETPKGPIEGLPLMGPFFIIYALDLPSVFEKKSIHMSTRNPMNDRYQTDGPKGPDQEISCSSLKPKSKAASSVYVKSTQKTPQEKKAAQRPLAKSRPSSTASITIRLRLSTKVQAHLVGHARRRYRLRWSPWALAPGGPITRL